MRERIGELTDHNRPAAVSQAVDDPPIVFVAAGTRVDGSGNEKSRVLQVSCCRVFAVSFVMLSVPRIALACPVCFGNSDAPMAKATNTGIIFMLVIVGLMLTAFASFFIYLIRRANRVAVDAAPAAEPARLAPSEGTAQC